MSIEGHNYNQNVSSSISDIDLYHIQDHVGPNSNVTISMSFVYNTNPESLVHPCNLAKCYMHAVRANNDFMSTQYVDNSIGI